jgi:predicted nuclease with TOPRIM domain
MSENQSLLNELHHVGSEMSELEERIEDIECKIQVNNEIIKIWKTENNIVDIKKQKENLFTLLKTDL